MNLLHKIGSSINFVIVHLMVAITISLVACSSSDGDADECYQAAVSALETDSIETAFCYADKAVTLYHKENNTDGEARGRLIMSMILFSNKQTAHAYDTLKDLVINLDDTTDLILKTNYFRIKAYHASLDEQRHPVAVALIDSLLRFETNLPQSKLRTLLLTTDSLNKVEFLIRSGEIAEATAHLRNIDHNSANSKDHFAQFNTLKAQLLMLKGESDSAYAVAKSVAESDAKYHRDADNLLLCLNIMMHRDSLVRDIPAYISHRDLRDHIIQEQQGDELKFKLEMLSVENRMNMAQKEYEESRHRLFFWLATLVFTLIVVVLSLLYYTKIQKKNKRLVELECEKIDTECFKRKLECDLLHESINRRDEEILAANRKIIDLTHRLAQKGEPDKAQKHSFENPLEEKLSILNAEHEGFTDRLRESFPSITRTELILAGLIRLNLTTEEITHLMNISKSGLLKGRQRLRTRLNLASTSHLESFIMSL